MPAASGTPPPTMAIPGTIPLLMFPTCIEPPLPRQQPVTAPIKLEEQLFDCQPLGQRMAVAAERRRDEIARLEGRAHAHGGGLLPLALMNRAGHRPFQEQELDAVLELANRDHLLVEGL